MVLATDLDLHHLPISEQYFADDPDPHMIAAREKHPWLATSDFGIVITEYGAVGEIMLMDDRLKAPVEHVIAIMGGEGTNWARFERQCLIARDGVEHDRIRSAANKAFLPKAVNGYRDRIQLVISDLLDEWAPKGRFDFEEFASLFPVAVMFGLLGIPRAEIANVRQWLEMLGQSYGLNRAIFPQINDAFEQLWNFAEGLVIERLVHGSDDVPDLLDALIGAEQAGSIDRTELLDMLLFLFAAGYDTSKNQIGHIMLHMLDRPDMWGRCAADRKFCDEVTEEAFRHSGVSTSYRNVATSFDYRDVAFPTDAMLIFPLGVVCRYSGPFDNPAMFVPGRANGKRHTVFGRGMHICLGQFLAKLQIAEGIHIIAQRLRGVRRDGNVTFRLFPGVWGPKTLPIAFEPA